MELQERLNEVRSHIEAAERQAGRAAGSVQLVAVSKTFNADQIRPAISAGQRVFGENRVQESQGKWPELKAETAGIELHLIGPLQSNKAEEAVALFDCIQTTDRWPMRWRRTGSRAMRRACSFRSIPARSRKRPACFRPTWMRWWRTPAR